ncbi:MAG: UDP-N-acetylmuramyl peptide synthase [Bifidobacterium sp.]|nr:UDP-N-acetylmuramyl peptide synthase [Bifidobacterium sp.]
MSAISETVSQRMTLGMLVDRYGFDLEPSFARDVTVTSLANDVESVTPGALFIPGHRIDLGRLAKAVQRGAYAVMLPPSMRNAVDDCGVPVLFADPTSQEIGQLASMIAGDPAEAIAVFAIAGQDRHAVAQDVAMLAQFLHMLGNPVGIVCQGDTQSLERFVDLQYPVDAFSVQRVLSVCVEDGASAVIIALDDATLAAGSLESVGVDVLGYDGPDHQEDIDAMLAEVRERYGCVLDEDSHLAVRTDETDIMAIQADFGPDQAKPLSLSIAMVLAAGVRKANIRSALRVSRELH